MYQESLKEYTEKIQTVESNLTRVTKECEDLTKQLQACKAEYDEYESKDIQYHENMSAQKARQKKLKAKREKNEKDVNQKQETNKRLEDSLEDYATNIEKAKEEKVEIEKQLNSILQKFREEIDRLKEKKAEIEVVFCMMIDCRNHSNPYKKSILSKSQLLMKRRRSLKC